MQSLEVLPEQDLQVGSHRVITPPIMLYPVSAEVQRTVLLEEN